MVTGSSGSAAKLRGFGTLGLFPEQAGFSAQLIITCEKHLKVSLVYKRFRTFLIRRRRQVVNCQVARGMKMARFLPDEV